MSAAHTVLLTVTLASGTVAGCNGFTKPEPTAALPVVLAIETEHDEPLATLEFRKDGGTELTLTDQGPEGQKLEAIWHTISAQDAIVVEMHLPTQDGSRGPYGAVSYPRGTPSYYKGVMVELWEQDYEVEIVD